MELVRIEIESYKSIKEPLTVCFHENLPTVLIGKNGSGKTNILEALNRIAYANSVVLDATGGDLQYKAFGRLTPVEFGRLFPKEKYTEKKAEFALYNAGVGLRADTVESETIVPLLKKEFTDVYDAADQLTEALAEYERQLARIAYDEYGDLPLRCYDIVDAAGNTTDYHILKAELDSALSQTKQAMENFLQHMSGSDSTFTFLPSWLSQYGYRFDALQRKEFRPFRLRYKKPDLAAFEQKFITVDETAIKQEITRINKATADVCQRITELLERLRTQTARLLDLKTEKGESTGAVSAFMRDVQTLICSQCRYLQNENSLVLFKNPESIQNQNYRTTSQMIYETYARRCKGSEKEEKPRPLSEKERQNFETYLNENLPEFETDMFERISVDSKENGELSIYLHEKTKERIPLECTSAGRRWYFSYYFIKNALRPGDMFIIDEPAAMLHPCAQKEVLCDLLKLAKSGVRVVYSTHSPYLIPERWDCVGFVRMGEGTEIFPLDVTSEEFFTFRTYSSIDIFSYQEVAEKYDKSKFKKLLTQRVFSRVYEHCSCDYEKTAEVMQVKERTLYYWQDGENQISLPNLIKAAQVLRMDVLTLIEEAEG